MGEVKKYRKKPVVVEAMQYTVDNIDQFCDWCTDAVVERDIVSGEAILNVYINTLEGVHHVSPYDFGIKGVQGEFYPCKPDIFHATYESVDGE